MRTLIALALALTTAVAGCKSEEEQLADTLNDALKQTGIANNLEGLSRKLTDRLVGDKFSDAQRAAIAKQAAAAANSLLNGVFKGKDGENPMGSLLKGMLGDKGAPPALGDMFRKQAAPARSAAEEAALVSRLDLGVRNDPFPAALTGVRLGMTTEELHAARPNAKLGTSRQSTRRGKQVTTAIASEEASADSPIGRVSYHFEDGKLSASFVTLRVSAVSDALLAKATAKWGAPRADQLAKHMEAYYAKTGGSLREWSVGPARVKLEKTSYSPDVKIYIAQR